MFNIGINESKTLKTNHISCECKCKFDGKNCNSNQWWKNEKCWCECKKQNICEKDYIWDSPTCGCENGKYQPSIIDDSTIMCDEVKELYNKDVEAKLYHETNLNEKKATCKMQNIYIFINSHSIIDSC